LPGFAVSTGATGSWALPELLSLVYILWDVSDVLSWAGTNDNAGGMSLYDEFDMLLRVERWRLGWASGEMQACRLLTAATRVRWRQVRRAKALARLQRNIGKCAAHNTKSLQSLPPSDYPTAHHHFILQSQLAQQPLTTPAAMADTLSCEIVEMIVRELEEYNVTAQLNAKVFSPTLNVGYTDGPGDHTLINLTKAA
jgi:hypothetical protein